MPMVQMHGLRWYDESSTRSDVTAARSTEMVLGCCLSLDFNYIYSICHASLFATHEPIDIMGKHPSVQPPRSALVSSCWHGKMIKLSSHARIDLFVLSCFLCSFLVFCFLLTTPYQSTIHNGSRTLLLPGPELSQEAVRLVSPLSANAGQRVAML